MPEDEPTVESTPVLARLPAGHHKLPHEFVVRSQRDRLLDAMAQTCAAEGYGATTVAAVIARAEVSSKTFYEQFTDREDCFVAAYETILAQSLEQVTAAYEQPDLDWAARVRAAIGALLAFLAAEPAFARTCLVEVLAAGERALERHGSAVRALANVLDEGRSVTRTPDEIPASTAEAVIEGSAFLMREQILAGRTQQLETLRPDITYAALLPYLGQDEALRQAEAS